MSVPDMTLADSSIRYASTGQRVRQMEAYAMLVPDMAYLLVPGMAYAVLEPDMAHLSSLQMVWLGPCTRSLQSPCAHTLGQYRTSRSTRVGQQHQTLGQYHVARASYARSVPDSA
eukprot:2479390-Rhodomonas_salina.1